MIDKSILKEINNLIVIITDQLDQTTNNDEELRLISIRNKLDEIYEDTKKYLKISNIFE